MARPREYNTPEEIQLKIDEYFKEGVKKKKVTVGKSPIKQY